MFPRALLAVALSLFLAAALRAAEKPNIILIFTDDLGINDLSCSGRKDQPTPHLDKLAAEGVRFSSSFPKFPPRSQSWRSALGTPRGFLKLRFPVGTLPGCAAARPSANRRAND